MNQRNIVAIILILLTLSACSPSEADIATAISQTEEAAPTQVPPTETLAPEPTDIPTDTPTETPSSTPEPTPDPRVINTQPRLIILTVDDLAEIGEYVVSMSIPAYLVYSPGDNPYANLSCTLGYDGAVEFLDRTGLVTGWSMYFRLQEQDAMLPTTVVMTALVFDSVDGPERLFEFWGRPCELDFYDYIGEIPLGERTTMCRYEMWMANGELSHIRYRLAIQYRNVYIGMLAYAKDDDSLELEKFYQIALMQLMNMENLPLEDEVTLSQDFTTGAGCVTPPTPVVRNSTSSSSLTMGWTICDIFKGQCFSQCTLERPPLPPGEGSADYPYALMPCVYTGEKIIIKDPQN